jgi:HEAT repeat protein
VWTWQRNTPGARVERLLSELRREESSSVVEWLTEVGVMGSSRRRGDTEIINDLVAIGPSAVGYLLVGLDDPVPDAAGGAAVALGRLGDTRAVAPLLDKLTNPDWYLRYTAARALGDLRPMEAVPGLIALLADEEFRVVDSAVTALASIGPPVVDALLTATGDANPQVRQWSAAALGEIGEKRSAGVLGDLAANDPDGEVRDAARRALRELRSPR